MSSSTSGPARPAALVPAGAHLVASGHIRPGERTTARARFAIPAGVCAKLSATHPQLKGRPCYGTETITFDSKLTRLHGQLAPGAAVAASTVNVYNEYVCGPAQIWCFGVSAGWSVNYGNWYEYNWS